ncbi:acyl-CoA thioesterase domain-containing protein [Streptomyces sp. NPDC047525]|uniref:acyl-CoA thioesterase domain-containing protein n=1 Tax=Streptomyces sp. NPDC047525 TaxID=3155264 RepID=UPI0033DBBCEB
MTLTTLTVETPLGELRLKKDTEAEFTGHLPESFCFQGRGFGGYTAALAAFAGMHWASGRQLTGLHALFPNVAVAGDLTLKVVPLVQGRSAASCQVRVEQGDKLVVLASFWFVEEKLLGAPGPRARTHPVPAPESCEEIPWVAEVALFLKGLHARSADYPLSLDAFETDYRDGGNSMSLWAVPENAGTDATAGRLTDIMFLDAHMVDAGLRAEAPHTTIVSLDLSATWAHPSAPPDATLMEARADTSGELSVLSADLVSRDGNIRATGASQCRLYRPQP